MALRDILVHVDNSKTCEARVEVAIALARDHDAHLTGIYVYRELLIPTYAEVQVGAALMEAQLEEAQAQAQAAENSFCATLEKSGVAFEWRCRRGEPVSSMNLSARYSDLVVTGQAEDMEVDWVSATLSNRIALESGRPVLVIPYTGLRQPIGKRVLVAWNARREAVRAVHDALPLLVKAESVEVLSINPKDNPSGEGDIAGADLCLHLARHGVKAEAHTIRATDIDVANLLLSHAADQDNDLLVMGAYGHSRFRELVLGGATRDVLAHMTVPVLMSH